MITQNKDKKALVEKLLADKVITFDEAFLLTDEKETPEPIVLKEFLYWSYPVSQPYIYPNTLPYPSPITPAYPYPSYPVISFGDIGTIGGSIYTLITNETNVTMLDPKTPFHYTSLETTVEQALKASAGVSYCSAN